MNAIKHITYGLLLLATPLVYAQADTPDYAPDYAKEKRWAEQIVDFLIDGEPVWLEASQHKFLGIYTEASTATPHGAIILVHGGGAHPDWQQVIKPLRTELPAYGWATFSIQMPVLANRATERDYVPMFKYVPARFDAAVNYLRQRNINNIVIAAHSIGTNMASYYLATSQNPQIKAFVGIGMKGLQQPKEYSVLDNVTSLLQIKIPVLDVYGQHTNEDVLGSRYRRAFALKSVGNTHSRQIFIKGADHFYEGQDKDLLEKVTQWLDTSVVHTKADTHHAGVDAIKTAQ